MSRRGQVAVGILVLWVGGLGLLARRELFRPETERLAEAALRVTPGATYFSVLSGDDHIGFASSTIDTSAAGFTVADYLVVDVPVAGAYHRAAVWTNVRMTRGFRITGFDAAVETSSGRVKAAGTVRGDTLLELTVGADGAAPDTQRLRLDAPLLLPTLVPLAIALADRPKVGRQYTLPVFDPLSMRPQEVIYTITAESLFVVSDSARFDAQTRRWSSALDDTVRGWRVVPEDPRGFALWLDEHGRVILAGRSIGLPAAGDSTGVNALHGFALRRTAYELAFENWRLAARERPDRPERERDVYETSAIAARVKRPVSELAELRVRLGNVDLRGFDVGGGRQSLRGDTLTVRREDGAALVASYQVPMRARGHFQQYLMDEPLLEVNDRALRSLAARAGGYSRDPRVVAERLLQWVHDSLEKRITVGVPSAVQVMRARSGDCNEHTQLYVAMARARGIPARAVAGLAFVRGKFYYHAWPEIYLGGWVAVDPTFGQFPADAAHLRFVSGGLARQAELLRLVGSLEIDVLASR